MTELSLNFARLRFLWGTAPCSYAIQTPWSKKAILSASSNCCFSSIMLPHILSPPSCKLVCIVRVLDWNVSFAKSSSCFGKYEKSQKSTIFIYSLAPESASNLHLQISQTSSRVLPPQQRPFSQSITWRETVQKDLKRQLGLDPQLCVSRHPTAELRVLCSCSFIENTDKMNIKLNSNTNVLSVPGIQNDESAIPIPGPH